jgi:hypothetical protein
VERAAPLPISVDDGVVGLEVSVDDAPPVEEPGGAQELEGEVERPVGLQRAFLADDRLE